MRKCVTHHLACDCREKKIEELVKACREEAEHSPLCVYLRGEEECDCGYWKMLDALEAFEGEYE